MSVRNCIGVLIALSIAAACGDVKAQICVTPDPPPPTLWTFLGIPQTLTHFRDSVANRFGKHPFLEPKPPIKPLAHPANLESKITAIKAAAEIKVAEDLKPQKIKAVRFLAGIGCGCYDKDEKVTKAMLASMDDCTEEVRLAAIKALSQAARKEYCQHCKQKSCCSEKVVQQLSMMAYEQDESGCFLEPSARVRQAAMEALWMCPRYEEPEEPEPSGIESGAEPDSIEGSRSDEQELPPASVLDRDEDEQARRSSRGIPRIFDGPVVTSAISDRATPANNKAESEMDEGAVVLVNYQERRAQLRISGDQISARPGTKVLVYYPKQDDYVLIGQLEVIDVVDGAANLRPVGDLDLSALTRGAVVVIP